MTRGCRRSYRPLRTLRLSLGRGVDFRWYVSMSLQGDGEGTTRWQTRGLVPKGGRSIWGRGVWRERRTAPAWHFPASISFPARALRPCLWLGYLQISSRPCHCHSPSPAPRSSNSSKKQDSLRSHRLLLSCKTNGTPCLSCKCRLATLLAFLPVYVFRQHRHVYCSCTCGLIGSSIIGAPLASITWAHRLDAS